MLFRRPIDVLALLVLLALLLCALQYCTISKFSVLDSAGYVSLGYFIDDARAKIRFDALDAALSLGLVGVFAALVFLEMFGRRLTILIGWVCASERRAMAAVVVAGAVSVR